MAPGSSDGGRPAAAAAGVVIVIAAGLACLPAFVEFMRADGWRGLWPLARRMVVSVAMAGAVSIGIVAWNDHLGPSTDTPAALRIAGVLAGLVVIGALVVTCGTLIAIVYRLRFSPRITRLLGMLAVTMTVALVAIFAGSLTWWISTAIHAPWFFGSLVPRSPATPAPLAMIVLGLMLLSGVVLAGIGAARITAMRSHVDGRPSPIT